jgi:hypothetical protein
VRRPPKLALAIALIALHVGGAIAGLEHQAAHHDVPVASGDDLAGDDDNLGARHDRGHAAAHEHCALAPADADVIAPAIAIVVIAPAPVTRVAPAPPTFVPRPASILSVAPKTSPPG